MSCPARFATPRTPSRKTHGARLNVVGEALGTPFMPWQQQVADVAGEVDPRTGRLAYREVRVTVPRQSGKTALMLPLMVYRCLGAFGQRQRIVYTAQDRNKARKKFIHEHVDMLNNSQLRGMFKPNFSHGEEHIYWHATGSTHGIDASKDTSGHGDTLDIGVIDEAFARPDSVVEQALLPAMATRSSAQLWVISTAGTARSKYLRGKVDDGRARVSAGQTRGIAYFEWSAPDDIDMDDESLWPSFMPALGHTIDIEAVRAARDSMASEVGKFARAYGNVWDDKRTVVAIIPADAWDRCEDVSAEPGGRLYWSVDTAEDRSWTAVAAAGYTADGRELVDCGDHRPGSSRWVLPRLLELARQTGCWDVALDAEGPAAALEADLTDSGFKVDLLTLQERARACGAFLEAALSLDEDGNADRLVHVGNEDIADALVLAERKRVAKVWEWASATGEISALRAATWARYALSKGEPWHDALGSIG